MGSMAVSASTNKPGRANPAPPFDGKHVLIAASLNVCGYCHSLLFASRPASALTDERFVHTRLYAFSGQAEFKWPAHYAYLLAGRDEDAHREFESGLRIEPRQAGAIFNLQKMDGKKAGAMPQP
jgi:hypothetical protein